VRRLHDVIVWNAPSDHVLGPTWEQIHGLGPVLPAGGPPWWQDRRDELQRIAHEHGSAYVYNRASSELAAQQLLGIRGVDRVFYAMKANPHPELLKTFAGLGLSFECVSRGECERVMKVVPGIDPSRILFTPNFAPRSEYEWAIERGVNLTIDNVYALREWGELFRNRDVLIRIDTGFSVASGPVTMPSGPISTASGPPMNCQTSRFSPVTGFCQTSMISSVSNLV
jgi:diaminopimelate decarboxylase/aspartate kinase